MLGFRVDKDDDGDEEPQPQNCGYDIIKVPEGGMKVGRMKDPLYSGWALYRGSSHLSSFHLWSPLN